MLHLLLIIIQVNIRENRRGNNEWKIQRNKQHWAQYTDGKIKTQKTKRMSNTDRTTKSEVIPVTREG